MCVIQMKGEELADDDPQMSYMISAWARICKILGGGFAPYLPMVMAPVMKTASMKPEVALLDNDEVEGVGEDSDDWQFVNLGEQQNFGIKTAGLEDKATACQMLVCYARELKEHFADYTEQVGELCWCATLCATLCATFHSETIALCSVFGACALLKIAPEWSESRAQIICCRWCG